MEETTLYIREGNEWKVIATLPGNEPDKSDSHFQSCTDLNTLTKQYQCKVCGEKFSDRDSFDDHYDWMHNQGHED